MDIIEKAILIFTPHLYHSAKGNFVSYVSSLSDEQKKNLIDNLPPNSLDEKDSLEETVRKVCCVLNLMCKYFNQRECNTIFRNPDTVNHMMKIWRETKGDIAQFIYVTDSSIRMSYVAWFRNRIPQEELQELLNSNICPSTQANINISEPEKIPTRRRQGYGTLERAFNAVCRQTSNNGNSERASDRHTQQSSIPQNLIPQTAVGGMAVRQAVGNKKNFAPRNMGETPALTIDQMSALLGTR